MSTPIQPPPPAVLATNQAPETDKPSYEAPSTLSLDEKGVVCQESAVATTAPPFHGSTLQPNTSDLEAQIAPVESTTTSACHPSRVASKSRLGPECQQWPGKEHWKQNAKVAKLNRSRCGCLARMKKRDRHILRAVVILLIVGIGLAVGFGISHRIHARVPKPTWTSPR